MRGDAGRGVRREEAASAVLMPHPPLAPSTASHCPPSSLGGIRRVRQCLVRRRRSRGCTSWPCKRTLKTRRLLGSGSFRTGNRRRSEKRRIGMGWLRSRVWSRVHLVLLGVT